MVRLRRSAAAFGLAAGWIAALAAGSLSPDVSAEETVAAPQRPSPAAGPGDQASVPLRVAILNVDRVFQEAKAVDAIRDHIRASLNAYRAQVQAEEDQIRDAQQELARKRAILTDEAYEEERRKLEQRLLRAQAVVQERKRNLDETQLQGMSRVQAELNRIVTEIANERALTLILRKDLTVLAASALEITDEVIERINIRLPDYDAVQFGSDADLPEN